MRILIILALLLLYTNSIFSQLVDAETPENVQPDNSVIGGVWELEFSDEFNGSAIGTDKWVVNNSTKSRAGRPSIGINDWRWKPENVSVENGNLILKVYKTGSHAMTNGSVNSNSKYLTKYGYIETRIKVGEADKGTHTAFWLQGPNMGNVDGTANDGAEIDVFETAWTGDYTKSVVHIDGYGANHKANTKKYDTPGIHSGFHTWGFHWTENFMDIYYDGVFKVRYSESKWVVKSLEYLWLSNGASFGLSGDQYFINYPIGYLTETQVDYIRVWKQKSATEVDETLLKQDNWQLILADSEDAEGAGNPAVNAFDGNPYSFWHTEWFSNKPVHPHEIQIDLGGIAKIEAFKYLPRQDGVVNGNITEYEFFVGNDSLNWSAPVASGTFVGDNTIKTVNFDEPIEGKFIRLVASAAVNNTAFTNVAEIYLKGNYLDEEDYQVGINDPIETDLSIFPNPIQNKVNLRWDRRGVYNMWRIYSIDGMLLKEGFIPSVNLNLAIEVGDLKRGLYIIEVRGSECRVVKKIIKK